jgi:curved DNA-binding protein CbpA
MSSIDTSLATLGLTTLEKATSDTLRRAFAAALKESHPDRGGNDALFDEILSAYACLTTVLKRQSGGRDGLPCLDIEEVQQTREQQWIHELNNSVYDVLDSLSDTAAFQREFNEQFEKLHVSESKGYAAWLKEDAPVETAHVAPAKKRSLTDKPVATSDLLLQLYQQIYSEVHEDEKEDTEDTEDKGDRKGVDPQFHQRFTSLVPRNPQATTDLILHPNDMATYSGALLGVALLEKDAPFTSALHERPEYSDLFHAYTSDHLLFDKLPVFSGERSIEERMEEYRAERERVYDVVEDRDGAIIQAYEKKREEEEAEHKRKITEYFQQTASSQWALRGSR